MILYFSGTGNSACAAKVIGAKLNDEVINLFEKIRSHDYTPMESSRPWVIVVPTYAWRVPRIVSDWLLRTELRGHQEMYFVMTCGDSNGDAGRYAEKLCRKKNMVYRGCVGVRMPENYIALFEAPGERLAKALVLRGISRAEMAADVIAAGETLVPAKLTKTGKLQSSIVNPVFYAFVLKDRKFYAKATCVGCGRCAEVCPMSNITLKNGKPKWNGHCTHCMACISTCPKAAIEYGKATDGKVRYLCPEK